MTISNRPNEAEPHDADRPPLHQYLTYRMSVVQSLLNAQAGRMLRKSAGITLSQWRVIALVGAAGQTRLSELAREAALDKGLLSRNLKTLIEAKIVISQIDESDHRAHILSLSTKGKELFTRTLPITRARQRLLAENISEEEMRIFRKVLDKLEIAAKKRPPE